jgi:hypothetical protein
MVLLIFSALCIILYLLIYAVKKAKYTPKQGTIIIYCISRIIFILFISYFLLHVYNYTRNPDICVSEFQLKPNQEVYFGFNGTKELSVTARERADSFVKLENVGQNQSNKISSKFSNRKSQETLYARKLNKIKLSNIKPNTIYI